ncbi:MAG: phosphatidylglycerophosphatase A [Kofleriaceae bacterium]|nr:phosphatidylglycerophosphatase A [Kofleriaceae bacterium]MCL4224592.1 phosphatidylglycerophosphatase A [Myxococcales bacterium]
MTMQAVVSFVARAVATAGGAGYSPVAPGTCGTVVAVPLAWVCRGSDTWQFLALIVVVTLVGIAAAHRADRDWGSHDSGRIVIDEVAGYLATVALVDRGSWWVLGIGFVVFRALDILKPPPVRWLDEHVPGGAGVVLDDVAAGVMGAAIMVGLDAAGAFEALARVG